MRPAASPLRRCRLQASWGPPCPSCCCEQSGGAGDGAGSGLAAPCLSWAAGSPANVPPLLSVAALLAFARAQQRALPLAQPGRRNAQYSVRGATPPLLSLTGSGLMPPVPPQAWASSMPPPLATARAGVRPCGGSACRAAPRRPHAAQDGCLRQLTRDKAAAHGGALPAAARASGHAGAHCLPSPAPVSRGLHLFGVRFRTPPARLPAPPLRLRCAGFDLLAAEGLVDRLIYGWTGSAPGFLK